MAATHSPAMQALCSLASRTADPQAAADWGLLVHSLAECAEFGVPATATHADTTRLMLEVASHLGKVRAHG